MYLFDDIPVKQQEECSLFSGFGVIQMTAGVV